MHLSGCLELFALTVLWMTAPLTQGLEPCVDEGLYKRVYSCFSNQGLNPPLPQGKQDPNQLLRETQIVDSELQCKRKEQYKAASNCTLRILRACLALVGMEGAIPDVNRFQQGIDIVCSRTDDIDAECLKEQYPIILGCGERMVTQLVHQKTGKAPVAEIICLSSDVNYDCASEYLKPCGNDTRDIFLHQLDKYQIPAVCVNKSPSRPGRLRHDVTSGSRADHSAGFFLTSCLAAAMISFMIVVLLH